MRRALLLLLLLFLFEAPSFAEYPALDETMSRQLAPVATRIGKRRTADVVIRNETDVSWNWNLRAALQTEIVSQLRLRDVNAREVEQVALLRWLADSARPISRASVDRWRKGEGAEVLFVGRITGSSNALKLQMAAFHRVRGRQIASLVIPLRSAATGLTNNIPTMNRRILQFSTQSLGHKIGSGECSDLAAKAIESAGGRQWGIYVFGRELAAHEAIVPGDVLQFERVEFTPPKGGRTWSMRHHTAVVETVKSPELLGILHQNFGKAGKTVSKYQVDLSQITKGTLVIYRPSTGTGVLPLRLSPRRREPARPVILSDGRVDLLKTIDPGLDSVHGIWHMWEGHLTAQKENYARLQIPYDLPKSYSVRARVKRIYKTDQLSFGLVVGGKQVLFAIDSYGGNHMGLHLVDGKKVRSNATTVIKPVLPMDKEVLLEIRVTANSVEMDANGNTEFQWRGDARRFSMQKEWMVPRNDWLFLGAYASRFEIYELILQRGP